MKEFRNYISHMVHDTIPEKFRKFRQMDQETGAKVLQYLMLCVLLYLCFILPKAGAEKTLQESAQGKVMQEEAQEEGTKQETARQETEQNGAQQETEQGGTQQGTEQSGTQQRTGGAQQEKGAQGGGTIVIDAGHGGDDPGMIGPSGISEKVLNLIYAKKLGALLEEQGYRVVMTRETEEGLYDAGESNKKAQDMQRRVAVIAKEEPLLTVSIHQNSYPDAAVAGPQVFYYEHSAEGEKLAASVQEALNTELEIERPRVHKGNTSYYILKRSKSVTVIVECGFLTNPEEEAKLQEEGYQDQVVQAICDGVKGYLEGDAA